MHMNLYEMECQMLERKAEVEKAAATAWKWSGNEKQSQLFKSLVSSLAARGNKAQIQTSAACCCCC